MKKNWKKWALNALVGIVVVAALALLAHALVGSVNVVELIRRFHGG
jgi:hypothetical protein